MNEEKFETIGEFIGNMRDALRHEAASTYCLRLGGISDDLLKCFSIDVGVCLANITNKVFFEIENENRHSMYVFKESFMRRKGDAALDLEKFFLSSACIEIINSTTMKKAEREYMVNIANLYKLIECFASFSLPSEEVLDIYRKCVKYSPLRLDDKDEFTLVFGI